MPRSAPAWLRPSALPRLAACPASGVESEPYPDAAGEAAAIGTAWHEVAAVWMGHGREAAESEIDRIAHRLQVDAGTLRDWLAGVTQEPPDRRRWIEHTVELQVAGVTLRGTLDLGLEGDPPEVVDYKTGNPDFADASAWWQLKPYGVAFGRERDASQVRLSLLYLQLGDEGWLHHDIDVDEAAAELETVVRQALAQAELPQAKRRYRTGPHCTFCPARVACPALLSDLRAFTALEQIEPALVTAENAAPLLERARAVEKLAKAAKDAVKAFVEAHGGEVAVEDGALRLIHMKETHVPAHTRSAYSYVRQVKG